MSKFILTAQLRLQPPANTRQVISNMRRTLESGVDIPVKIKDAAKAKKEIDAIASSAKRADSAAKNMGRSFGLAIKRFAAFTVASRAISLFTNGMANAVNEAINFQREMVKISQVTGKTVSQLKDLDNTITHLSTSLGVSSKELLGVGRILAQAGIQANDLKIALAALAKTTLAPTFEDINKTAEGAVAILAQFGKGVGALEQQLGAINAVAGKFAVESGDLIGAVRRVGGVFVEAGGDLEELLGLFTSVRATTRESAESIATGLRTIFTRIQRPKTIDFMREYGVELTSLDGKFVGPMEAVKRLNAALQGLDQGDIRFVQIAEQLGGFRQIGKVIPLLKQYELAEKARQEAVKGGNSLDRDAITAQQALAVQIMKVRQEFEALIRGIADTTTFQTMIKGALNFASALISIADAIKPLLPILAALGAIKAFKGITAFGAGIGASLTGKGKNQGGRIHAFARGGVVPGTGNRDTVPAMLTPGEFVIRKSSVNKIGTEKLSGMNKYAYGGTIKPRRSVGYVVASQEAKTDDDVKLNKKYKAGQLQNKQGVHFYGLDSMDPKDHVRLETSYKKLAIKGKKDEEFTGAAATDAALKNIDSYMDQGSAITGFPKRPASNISGDTNARDTLNGFILEQVIRKFGGKAAEGGSTPFDFQGVGALGKAVKNAPIPYWMDAAKTYKRPDDIAKKIINANAEQGLDLLRSMPEKKTGTKKRNLGGIIQRFAMGGIAKASRVGAAILDPDEDHKDVKKRIGPNSVKKYITGKGYDKNRAQKGFGKVFPGKDYTLVKQGLNQKTSEGFRTALLDGAAQGLGDAVSGLSSDLGLGSASFKGDGKAQMASYLGSRAIGELYEAGANMLTNQGAFKNTPVSAPWDFPGGLSGKLSDNFNKMPSSWVDAKSSYAAAGTGGMFNKVAEELADEYKRSGEYAKAINKSKSVKTTKAAKGGVIQKLIGGGKAGPKSPRITGTGIFDSDYILGGTKDKNAILNAILSRGNISAAIWGAAGSGKTSLAKSRYGANFVLSLEDVGKYSDFAILSGAGATKKGSTVGKGKRKATTRFSDSAAKSFASAAKIIAVLPSNLELAKRRGARAAGPAPVGDQRSQKGLAGTRRAPGTDYSLAAELKRFGKPVEIIRKASGGAIPMAAGGEANIDSVPALLTPGEFVINKKSASRIGYGNLGRMNRVGYASGGRVQRFADGGKAAGGGMGNIGLLMVLPMLEASMGGLTDEVDGTKNAFGRVATYLTTLGTSAIAVKMGLESMGFAVTAKGMKEFFGTGPNSLTGLLKGAGGAVKSGLGGAKYTKRSEKMGGGFDFRQKGKFSKDESGIKEMKGGTGDMLRGLTNASNTVSSAFSKGVSKITGWGIAIKAGVASTLANTAALIKNTLSRTKIGKQAVGGFDNFLKGLKGKAGRNLKTGRFERTPMNRMGQGVRGFGGRVGRIGRGAGGLLKRIPGVGRVAGLAARGVGAAAGGAGLAVGGLAGAALAAAGPIAAVALAAGLVSGGLSKLFDAQGQYEKALKEGNLAEAQKNAVLKEAPGLIQLFGEGAASAWADFGSLFGGRSAGVLKQQAKVAVEVARYDREKADNAKDAAEALKDLEAGAITATQALAVVTKNFKAAKLIERETEKLRQMEEGSIDWGDGFMGYLGAGLRNTGAVLSNTFTFAHGSEFQGTRRERMTAEGKKRGAEAEVRSKAEFESLRGDLKHTNKSFINAGENFDEAFAAAGLGGEIERGSKQFALLKKDYEQQQKAIEENVAFMKALNMGLRDVNGRMTATTSAMGRLEAAAGKVVNSFERSYAILEQATTSAAVGLSDDEIARAKQDLVTAMQAGGATEKEIDTATGSIDAMKVAQNSATSALKRAGEEMARQGRDVNPETVKEEFIKSLTQDLDKQGVSKEEKSRILDSLSGIDFNEADIQAQLRAQDFSSIAEKGLDPLAKAIQEQALGPLKQYGEQQQILVSLTKARIEAERAYVEAQKKAIDVQIDAAKLFEEFGGAKFTSDQQLSARRAQANLSLEAAGVRGLSGGGVTDIRRAAGSVMNQFGAMKQRERIATFGSARGAKIGGKLVEDAYQGPEGEDAKKRDQNLKAANTALVTFTKQRIDLLKEELKIVQKKNAAEQKSLDALLGGDIDKFLEGQQAATAAAALATGDASVIQGFGAASLGAGVKVLQERGAADDVVERGASLALARVGISDARAAQLMAGTTDQENRIKEEGRELSRVLGDLGQQGADFAQIELMNAQVNITSATISMERQKGGKQAALGLYGGGPVYANNGLFVPRGTDTVPAMLTPGEFVVNRGAVNKGNNRAVLQAINGGAAPAAPMSRGGPAYMANGGIAGGGGMSIDATPLSDAFSEGANSLVQGARDFGKAIDKINTSEISVRMPTTNIVVTHNTGMLNAFKDELKAVIMDEFRKEVQGSKFDESGNLNSRTSGLS